MMVHEQVHGACFVELGCFRHRDARDGSVDWLRCRDRICPGRGCSDASVIGPRSVVLRAE
jgi:hypothetical protein